MPTPPDLASYYYRTVMKPSGTLAIFTIQAAELREKLLSVPLGSYVSVTLLERPPAQPQQVRVEVNGEVLP